MKVAARPRAGRPPPPLSVYTRAAPACNVAAPRLRVLRSSSTANDAPFSRRPLTGTSMLKLMRLSAGRGGYVHMYVTELKGQLSCVVSESN